MACESDFQPSDSLVKSQYQFFKIILDSSIQEKKLMLPPKFAATFWDELSAIANLSVADGRIWQVRLTKEENHIFFHGGWDEFVQYYSIRHGYFLVFSYKWRSNFQVSIFDMTACEIDYPINGSSSEQEPNHEQQVRILDEDETEEGGIVEILGVTDPLNKMPRKQAMNESYSVLSENDITRKKGNASKRSSKRCRSEDSLEIIDLENLDETSECERDNIEGLGAHKPSSDETKNQKEHPNKNVENLQSLVHDLNIQFNQSETLTSCYHTNVHTQFNDCQPLKSADQICSNNKSTDPCEDELQTKSKVDAEIIVNEKLSTMHSEMFQTGNPAVQAARLSKPKHPPSKMISVRYTSARRCVYLPVAFANTYLSRNSKSVGIQNSDGSEWSIRVTWRRIGGPYLTEGWSTFAEDNNLEEGDVCVFEPVKKTDTVLKLVSIYHASPE